MSWTAKLLIASMILSVDWPTSTAWADHIGHAQNGQVGQSHRVAQLKKDPETDPGGLPGRMDDRPRTRGISPSAPQRYNRANEPAEDRSKAAPAMPETAPSKPEKSEKRQ